MSEEYSWRAALRSDRPLLQGFQCTEPFLRADNGRRLPHDKPWEAEVQAHIRSLGVPGHPRELIRLGISANGDLVSVTDSYEFFDASSGLAFKMLAVAVTREERGQGGRLADAAVEDALTQMAARAKNRGESEFLVFAFVDERNVASQRMCTRMGFAPAQVAETPSLRRWAMTIEVGDE